MYPIPRPLPQPDVLPRTGAVGNGFGMGRRPAEDPRDAAYPLSAALPRRAPGVRYRYWWDRGWWGDQGWRPWCVAYAWLHWLEDGPSTVAPRAPGVGPAADPSRVYYDAQRIDEWPGEAYDGTSVRAGAKVLQGLGFIREYRWGWTLEDLLGAVLQLGPVVVGTWWYAGMFNPDAEGRIRISGPAVGGHAYLINGVSVARGLFRLKNSWGRRWGNQGRAWISFADMERLIHEQGEVCIALQERTR